MTYHVCFARIPNIASRLTNPQYALMVLCDAFAVRAHRASCSVRVRLLLRLVWCPIRAQRGPRPPSGAPSATDIMVYADSPDGRLAAAWSKARSTRASGLLWRTG